MWRQEQIFWYWSRRQRRAVRGTRQAQTSLVSRSHLTTHQPTEMWEQDEKKTPKALLTLPDSYLHLFVLSFYILIELILHLTDSVSHFLSSAQF